MAITTGENGTGKTILLDPIRGLSVHPYGGSPRAIWRNGTPFLMEATLVVERRQKVLKATETQPGTFNFGDIRKDVSTLPLKVEQGQECPNGVVDFWRSALPADTYTINQLTR
ncbi:hypothetical protein [Sorangium cellulosum]|uniref:hypothetical protein n=1 Tax=Sorangium cellulosum TaxID=56 RepID=UPI0012DB6B30|nr:hypothetical protein [Sorangium cellulosum]